MMRPRWMQSARFEFQVARGDVGRLVLDDHGILRGASPNDWTRLPCDVGRRSFLPTPSLSYGCVCECGGCECGGVRGGGSYTRNHFAVSTAPCASAERRTATCVPGSASGAVQHQLALARCAHVAVDWELRGTPPVAFQTVRKRTSTAITGPASGPSRRAEAFPQIIFRKHPSFWFDSHGKRRAYSILRKS